MTDEQQLKLQAFLDGELPESEAREILAWSQRDREAASLLTELRNTRQAMAKSEPHLGVPESREFFWSKISRKIQRQESPVTSEMNVSIFARLRRFFFPTVAVSALLVAGFIAHFSAPQAPVETVADADTPTVETTLASADAATYRDASDGTTLVWFSDAAAGADKKPAAVN